MSTYTVPPVRIDIATANKFLKRYYFDGIYNFGINPGEAHTIHIGCNLLVNVKYKLVIDGIDIANGQRADYNPPDKPWVVRYVPGDVFKTTHDGSPIILGNSLTDELVHLRRDPDEMLSASGYISVVAWCDAEDPPYFGYNPDSPRAFVYKPWVALVQVRFLPWDSMREKLKLHYMEEDIQSQFEDYT